MQTPEKQNGCCIYMSLSANMIILSQMENIFILYLYPQMGER